MDVATKRDRPETAKSRRTKVAEDDVRSSSDPIALHHTATTSVASDGLERGGVSKKPSSSDLNIGHAKRRRERLDVVRMPVNRLQPYSPPGFFNGVNLRRSAPLGTLQAVANRKREPAAIPRLSSQIREELQLVQDVSLELSSADDDGNTASPPSSGSGRHTIKALKSQTRRRSDDDARPSSFDQLQLQHPFSEKSWRNSGFELDAAPGLTYRHSSDESLGDESDAKVGLRVTQSWKPVEKESLDRSSSGDEESRDDSEESDSDGTDSTTTIDSFSLEFPRAASPDHGAGSTQVFASPIDSPSDCDFARQALHGGATADSPAKDMTLQTGDHVGTSADRQGESTPLTDYAVSETTQQFFGSSFTLRTDDLGTVRLAKTLPRRRKPTTNQASSLVIGSSTPLTAFQATVNTASWPSSYKSATLRPSMAVSSKNKTSSRIADSSTPLTALQVTLPSSSHVPPITGLVTSTPLSNYAADLTVNLVRHSGRLAGVRKSIVVEKDRTNDAYTQSEERLTDAGDPSIECGRERLESLHSSSLDNTLKPSGHVATPISLTNSISTGDRGASGSDSPEDQDHSPNEAESVCPMEDMPLMQHDLAALPPVRKRARRPAKTTHAKRQKTKQVVGHNNEEARSLRPWNLIVDWDNIDQFELSVEYVI
ncbi:hypothetical protein NCC49_002926 [Naganishia albida]|nr:hypothetical protein NCC49_002926 [Naganishia albida]